MINDIIFSLISFTMDMSIIYVKNNIIYYKNMSDKKNLENHADHGSDPFVRRGRGGCPCPPQLFFFFFNFLL